MKLVFSALTKFIIGALLVAAMLFLPAWTLDYMGAWLFMALLFMPMLIMGIVMLIKAPELLKKRLDSKEKQKTQKGVLALSGIILLCGFILSAFDHRFLWSSVPEWLTAAASVVFILGYALYAEVMRENAYLSRTVEVQEGQKVIDTGLYGVVRHPMYLATFLMFLSIPLLLGSFWGFVPFALYPIVIIVRLFYEEKLLTRELAGYADYMKRVKYRILPFIW